MSTLFEEAAHGPCPATARAVLGAVALEGCWIRCGLVKGHEGWHRFEMSWNDGSGQ